MLSARLAFFFATSLVAAPTLPPDAALLTPAETRAIAEAAAAVRLAPPSHLVFVGDSLTAFFPELNYVAVVRDALRPRHGDTVRVTNAGIGGDTITRVLARLEKDVLQLTPPPTHVFIFLGHNDSKLTSASGYETSVVSPADYERGLRFAVATIRARTGARVTLLSSASSVYEITKASAAAKAAVGTAHNLFGQPASLEKFNAISVRVAAATGASYLDVYTPMRAAPDKAALFAKDGVHVNHRGNRLIAVEVLRHLAQFSAPPTPP
jgi:lysophospholipase L1-like esterase